MVRRAFTKDMEVEVYHSPTQGWLKAKVLESVPDAEQELQEDAEKELHGDAGEGQPDHGETGADADEDVAEEGDVNAAHGSAESDQLHHSVSIRVIQERAQKAWEKKRISWLPSNMDYWPLWSSTCHRNDSMLNQLWTMVKVEILDDVEHQQGPHEEPQGQKEEKTSRRGWASALKTRRKQPALEDNTKQCIIEWVPSFFVRKPQSAQFAEENTIVEDTEEVPTFTDVDGITHV